MRSSTFLSILASFSSVSGTVYKGFNYGNTFTDGSAKTQSDFEAEFKAASNLVGASGFTSARLYTMIQHGTTSDPIAAIPAAIAQKTSLLLGLWVSGGQTGVTNEIAALTAAISKYGSDFADLVVGISVGSEDLYRESPTGILNESGVGANPADVVDYIGQVKKAISGTSLSGASIGHVDTWNAWTNSSNNAVIDAIDWLGVDEYPYFQSTQSNGIENAYSLFWTAYEATVAVSGGKPVWITETGWPTSGTKKQNLAVASVENAQTFWDQVGCASAFGKVNTWWYVLQDAAPAVQDPSFGLVGSSTSDAGLSTTPLYDLSCNNVTLPSSSVSSSATSTPTGKASASTEKSSGSGTATGSAKTSATTTTPGFSATGTGNAKTSATSGTSGTTTETSGAPKASTSNSAAVGNVAIGSGFLASALFAAAALL